MRLKWVGFALFAVMVLVVARQWPSSERSDENYCKTFRTAGERLHRQWASQSQQAQSNNDPLSAIGGLLAAPRDLADFFDKLEKVAPDEIEPDVARLRDGWATMADRLGDAATNPAEFLVAQLMLGASTKNSETRIDRWTAVHCGSL